MAEKNLRLTAQLHEQRIPARLHDSALLICDLEIQPRDTAVALRCQA